MDRKGTINWVRDADERVFDINEVQKDIKYLHPHVVKDNGDIELVPLGKDEGTLTLHYQPSKPEINEVGKTVAVYFKFLSSMAWVMVMTLILAIPMIITYSRGLATNSTGMGGMDWLSVPTMGNLGQRQTTCSQNNMQLIEAFILTCPFGSHIGELIELGYQSEDAKANENNFCPLDSSKDTNLTLSFDEDCSYSGFKENDHDTHHKLRDQFTEACFDSQECEFIINENYFPKQCRSKIGEQWNLYFDDDFNKFTSQEDYKPFMGYIVYECVASDIGTMSRAGVAWFVTFFDVLCVFIFLLAIWALQYFVRIDFDSAKDKTFEIS